MRMTPDGKDIYATIVAVEVCIVGAAALCGCRNDKQGEPFGTGSKSVESIPVDKPWDVVKLVHKTDVNTNVTPPKIAFHYEFVYNPSDPSNACLFQAPGKTYRKIDQTADGTCTNGDAITRITILR